MVIKMIQESYINLLIINRLIIGHLLDISSKHFTLLKTLIQNFHILKYDLLIKILHC